MVAPNVLLSINGLGMIPGTFITARPLREGTGAMGVPRGNRVNCRVGQKPREGGFTLIEMMIVIAIVGVTSALAVPSYIDWHAKSQLRQAATEIQNQLSLARISAMSRNSVVNVNLVLNSGKIQVSAGDASGASVIPATQMMSTVTGLNPAPTTVAFSPLGIRSGGGVGNQQISISNNRGLSYSVRVTPRGKVSWCPAATCP
jgi:type II secretion system protein H